MANNKALQALLEQVRDERQMYANTATRVGNAMLALLEYIENADYVRKDIPETLEHILTLLKGCVVGEGRYTLMKTVQSPASAFRSTGRRSSTNLFSTIRMFSRATHISLTGL